MKIPRPSFNDRAWFQSLVPDDPRVEVRPMFANLGAYVNGNMFMGSFGADVGLKLDADDQLALVAQGGGNFGPLERPMAGYVTLPAAWRGSRVKNDPWIARALAHVGELEPAAPKTKKRAPAKKL